MEVTEEKEPTKQGVNDILSKVYTFNGEEFRLTKVKLRAKHNYIKIISAYNDAIYFETASIPIEEVRVVEHRLNDELKKAYEQNLEISKDETRSKDDRDKALSEYQRIKGIYDVELVQFKNNAWLQSLIKRYNEHTATAVEMVNSDETIVIPVLKNILVGNTEVINPEADGILEFVPEVLNDFFTLCATMILK